MKQNIKIYVVHRVISDILGGDGTLGACLLESSWGIAQVSKHPETQHSVFFQKAESVYYRPSGRGLH